MLDVRLDPWSQIAPFWVHLVATVAGGLTSRTHRVVAATIVAVTVAALVLYAL